MDFTLTTADLPLPTAFSSHDAYYGVHVLTTTDAKVYTFRVYAPNAQSVSLVSGFFSWDNGKRMTKAMGGVWEITFPFDRSLEGECYKYKLTTDEGVFYITDPFAKREEGRGGRASLVATEIASAKTDTPWQEMPKVAQPLHVLEVSLASFYTKDNRLPYEESAACHYRELAEKLVIYLKSTNYTHVKLLPRVPSEDTSYFAPSPRYGTPSDFAAFVDTLHQNGVGVILSFYYPKTPYQSALLLSASEYFLAHYALDGIAFEANDADIPEIVIAFLEKTAAWKARFPDAYFFCDRVAHKSFLHITAERDTGREDVFSELLIAPPDQRGDKLIPLTEALISEKRFASQSKELTRGGKNSLMEAFYGSYEQKFAANRLYQTLLTVAKGCKLSFMMQSLAPFRPWQDHLLPEWYMADFKLHRAHRRFVRALNRLHLETPLLFRSDTRIELTHLDRENAIFSLKLTGRDGELIAVFNCSDTLAADYPLTVSGSDFDECFSSDEERYAGEGYVHRITLRAENGRIKLDLAPLTAVLLQPSGCKS